MHCSAYANGTVLYQWLCDCVRASREVTAVDKSVVVFPYDNTTEAKSPQSPFLNFHPLSWCCFLYWWHFFPLAGPVLFICTVSASSFLMIIQYSETAWGGQGIPHSIMLRIRFRWDTAANDIPCSERNIFKYCTLLVALIVICMQSFSCLRVCQFVPLCVFPACFYFPVNKSRDTRMKCH